MYHIKKDKRSIQSGGLIFHALRELMQEKEYRQITVTEIADKTGLSRATFYRSFDTIDDVLLMQCDVVMARLFSLLHEQIRRAGDNFDNREIHTLFLRFWYVDSDIITLLDQAHRLDILMDSFEKSYTKLAAQNGRLQGSDPRLLPYAISVTCGGSVGMLIHWVRNGKTIPPDELAELVDRAMQRMFETISRKLEKN